jgi:hypothetical protein
MQLFYQKISQGESLFTNVNKSEQFEPPDGKTSSRNNTIYAPRNRK